MPDRERVEESHESAVAGTTRRGMLRGAAGLGAAGLAAGVLAGVAAAPAGAATAATAATPATKDDAGSPALGEPLTVHIHDASSGVVDLYTGTQHVRFTDHQLAARLARAAR
jgi:hypothetical protein